MNLDPLVISDVWASVSSVPDRFTTHLLVKSDMLML